MTSTFTPSQDTIDKAARLEEVRRALGINKSELARRLGSDQSHINKVLKCRVNMAYHLTEKIIRCLHLNPTWFKSGTGSMFPPKGAIIYQ